MELLQNRSYFRTQSKPQQIQGNRNNPLHHVRSLLNKTTSTTKETPEKYSKTWKLSNTLLKNQWVTEVRREEIKEFLESNENENTTCQNLWDTAKAMLRGKFIAMAAYVKKLTNTPGRQGH
jgi:hypothetical protein